MEGGIGDGNDDGTDDDGKNDDDGDDGGDADVWYRGDVKGKSGPGWWVVETLEGEKHGDVQVPNQKH